MHYSPLPAEPSSLSCPPSSPLSSPMSLPSSSSSLPHVFRLFGHPCPVLFTRIFRTLTPSSPTDFLVWGNHFFVIASIGYLVAHFLDSFFSDNDGVDDFAINLLYLFLSLIFLFDAILYWKYSIKGLGWRKNHGVGNFFDNIRRRDNNNMDNNDNNNNLSSSLPSLSLSPEVLRNHTESSSPSPPHLYDHPHTSSSSPSPSPSANDDDMGELRGNSFSSSRSSSSSSSSSLPLPSPDIFLVGEHDEMIFNSHSQSDDPTLTAQTAAFLLHYQVNVFPLSNSSFAEIFNVAGATLAVLSSLIPLFTRVAVGSSSIFSLPSLFLDFFSMFLYMISSFGYYISWRRISGSSRYLQFHSIAFWAEFFNVTASIIYVIAQSAELGIAYQWIGKDETESMSALRKAEITAFVGDIWYITSSCCYELSYYRDLQREKKFLDNEKINPNHSEKISNKIKIKNQQSDKNDVDNEKEDHGYDNERRERKKSKRNGKSHRKVGSDEENIRLNTTEITSSSSHINGRNNDISHSIFSVGVETDDDEGELFKNSNSLNEEESQMP